MTSRKTITVKDDRAIAIVHRLRGVLDSLHEIAPSTPADVAAIAAWTAAALESIAPGTVAPAAAAAPTAAPPPPPSPRSLARRFAADVLRAALRLVEEPSR